MRRAIAPNGMRRIERECAAAEDRRAAALRGRETAARNAVTPPSALLAGWEDVPDADWTPKEVLGCYAAAHLAATGAEDPQLKTAASREKLGHIVRRLLAELAEGESPRVYVDWAVKEIVRGRGKRWPQDGAPSAPSLITGWILVKRWRASRGRSGSKAPRRQDFEEG